MTSPGNSASCRPQSSLSASAACTPAITWTIGATTPAVPHVYNLAVQVYLTGEAAPKPQVINGQATPRNSHHHWHKVGLKIKAPPAADCQMRVLLQNAMGYVLVDRISIQPVSDRQVDSLMMFLEGLKTP